MVNWFVGEVNNIFGNNFIVWNNDNFIVCSMYGGGENLYIQYSIGYVVQVNIFFGMEWVEYDK